MDVNYEEKVSRVSSFSGYLRADSFINPETSIASNAAQYGVADKILDCATFDLTQHPFRSGEIFDAIVTDPPYGVRAGAKRSGRKNVDPALYVPFLLKRGDGEGKMAHSYPDYVPPQQPWEMTEVIHSLCTLSLYLLKPGGRLVFFLPTDNEDYRDVDIPSIPGLKLIANSLQDYGKWGRRLITMEKVGESVTDDFDRGIDRLSLGVELTEEEKPKEGHRDFREKYWNSFKKN